MKFLGWLCFVGAIVWGSMLISDPDKVRYLDFGGEKSIPEHDHVLTTVSMEVPACRRCVVRESEPGSSFCRKCDEARSHYKNVSGDPNHGIQLNAPTMILKQAAPNGGIPLAGHNQFSPRHIRSTIISIGILVLLGIFMIFAVDYSKPKTG